MFGTSIRFPASLPIPDREGYGDEFEESRTAVDMEVGPKRRRQRTRTTPRLFDVQWTMSQTDFTAFDVWWQDTIKGGSLPFDVQLSDDFAGLVWYTCRAVEPYKADVSYDRPDTWIVKMRLRSIDEPFSDRPSGTSELEGEAFSGILVADGNLEVYKPLFGECDVGPYLDGEMDLMPFYGEVEVTRLELSYGRMSPV